MASVGDFFSSIDFFQIQTTFEDVGLYDYLFPYLLVYSLLVLIFPYAKIFQNKQGKANKPVIVLLSLIISFYGVSFEISQGQTIGMLLMTLFPNISALTILLLCCYVVGSMLGFDFLKGLFRKDFSAYLYYAFGGIGLAMTIFFVGISMGLWNYDPLDTSSMWNVIIAILFSVLSIIFFIIRNIFFGLLFATIVLAWVFGPQNESILMTFVDPVIFVIVLFFFFLSWVNKGGDNPKVELAKKLEDAKQSVEKAQNQAGYDIKEYDSRSYDIAHQNYLNVMKKWNDTYGEEDHKKYV